ncbi:alpha/beta fold hydrolase [Chromatium okenii]|uniref:Alpha/beta hydrolase n=1 Tax=Chromatium okenii TaxID=61644 RepID=A0A2S7XNN6_9GAMM|nr:alpha/beta fold hydrolase [Chromatium okenii]PQJ95335.1 alpha/beta hydrolase [Chromatium okenii]
MHGFTGSRQDWQPLVGNHSAVLALALPGHDHQPAPLGDFSHEINLLLQRLPPSIDRVIGYSFGGRLALGLLQAAPARFRAATIIAAHPGLTDAAQREQRRHADQLWIKQLRSEGLAAFVDNWAQQPLFTTQRHLPPAILARQRAGRLQHQAEGLASCLERLGLAEMPSTWATLAQFSGQLHWLVGGADQKFLELAQQVLHLRPATTLRIFDGIGHNPLLEAPEKLAEVLRSFI